MTLSIDIADGQLCVLVGPSGCGKLDPPAHDRRSGKVITDGEISIDGSRGQQAGTGPNAISRWCSRTTRSTPHMKVYDNMAYGLRNRGQSQGRDRRAGARGPHASSSSTKTPAAASPANCPADSATAWPWAARIVRHPKAFLFDEPLSNLDAKLRVHMRVEIKNLQRQRWVSPACT